MLYMEIMEPVHATHIELEFKGGEKCSFIRYWHEQDGDRQVERHEKLKHSKKFLEYKNRVFDIQGGILQPGVYQVNFST